MLYLGDYAPNSTVRFMFATSVADGARIDFSGALEVGDMRVYKDGSTTERASTAGFTLTSGFDSLTGVHYGAIDLSDNTTAGFYSAGSEYTIVLYPDTETIDSVAPAAILGQFSIARKPAIGVLHQGTAQDGDVASVTLATSAVDTDDYYNGCLAVIVSGLGAGQARYISDYLGDDQIVVVDPEWTVVPDDTSVVAIIASAGPTQTSATLNSSERHEIAIAVVEAELDTLETYTRSSNTSASIEGPDGSRTLTLEVDADYDPIKSVS